MELSKKSKQFLQFLKNILNSSFKTESFEVLSADKTINIYSKELKIGIISLVRDYSQAHEMKLAELFVHLNDILDSLKQTDLELEKLVIISTNDEEQLIDDYIEFLKKKKNIDLHIEFWGWQTITKLLQTYKYFGPEPEPQDIERHVNFVPTANIYQLFDIEEILKQIDEKLDSNITPVVIHNPLHGTGRTAIALAYAFHYKYQKKFDHLAYVEVVDNIKLNILTSFDGYSGFWFRPNLNIDQNLELLIQFLNKIPGRNLLIIDGIRTAEHATVLMNFSSKVKWKQLITSKFRIYTFENIYLAHPQPQTAIKIFNYYAQGVDQEIVIKIAQKVSYHPFALVFLAKSYWYFSKYNGLTPQQLEQMLEQKDNRVYHLYSYVDRSLSKNQVLLQRTILKYIMAFFDYQVRDLNNLERRILLIASVLPSQLITIQQLRQFVPYGTEEQFNDAVLMLISKGWLEADKNKFRVPSYVRMILHKKFKPTPNKLKRYIKLIYQKLQAKNVESLKWLSFAQALVKSMTHLDDRVADIALLIAEIFESIEAHKDALDYYQFAVYIYEQIATQVQDPELIELITKIWIKLQDFDRAIFYAHQLLEIQESQEQDQTKLADTYFLLAKLYKELDDYEKALYYAENAMDIYNMSLDEKDPRLEQIRQFHQQISQHLKNNQINQDKKQWFRRLFL